MRFILLLLLVLIPFSVRAQTTIHVSPSGNLQSAINNAQCGDVITLTPSKDGGVYLPPGDFVAFTLPAKNCTPKTPIWIRSAAAIPPDETRVGIADRPNMPKLIARVGSPGFFDVLNRASDYRFSMLWFTNQRRADGSGTTYLIGGGSETGLDINNFPRNIEIDHCFFNPLEWDEENGNNLRASVNYAVEVAGHNITVRDSYMTGFGARYKNTDIILDSGCVLIGTAPGPFRMHNNHCEAWFVGFFVGGGDPGTSNTATVIASTATTVTLSQTANLQAGDYWSYQVPRDHPDNPVGAAWGASIVESVSGNVVTLKIPTQVIGSNDNKRNGPPALVGGQARWRGWIPSDIQITRNTFHKPTRWYNLNGTDGKGFFEIKLGDRMLIDGNVFDGNTGFTITVRNQGGAAGWSVIKNLTMSNNLITRFGAMFSTLFDDNQQLSMPSSNIRFINNLAYGDTGPEPAFNVRPKVFSGQHGDLIVFDHNTVLQSGEVGRSGSGSPSLASREQITNWKWTNNITNWGTGEQYGFACLNSTDGSNEPCLPGYVWTKSVMVGAPTGPLPDRRSMANFPAGNFNPATPAEVGFVDPSSGNYRLRADSPFKGKATDGKDIGVDMDQLMAHIGGTAAIPIPTPVPSPITTPTPTPTPVSSPTPQPTPSSTPQPTPIGSPSPVPNSVSSVLVLVRDGDTPVIGALVSVNGRSMLTRADDGLAWFDGPTPLGSVITVTKEGYGFPRATVVAGTVEQLYFVVGGRVAPTPTPTPVVSPTPVPSPTVQPSPSPVPTPSPVPSPLPSCEMAITVPTLAQWSSGNLVVSITSPLPQSFSLSVTATSGQVWVMPPVTQSFTNRTSLTTQFKLQSKNKSASVVVSGPCGNKTVAVVVR